ncbi:MarR family transcriptional regulator [Vibrio pectenicida]|uniref:MarR family transcriptional regulator n=1 Tax=Vibrio pectenicida TaxID=62763 RepID=A0A7Y4A0H5_9VIBR|nr:MarR family transcriptional regulator [Vibrio pectenicida]NOH72505.1 MarR family transcriptional regulator [Vibrio pectenicida]
MDTTKSLELLEFELWSRWRSKVSDQANNELTNNELDYLYALNGLIEDVSLSSLACQMNVSNASASSMVSKLESKGYLAKIKNNADGRGVRLVATEKANALRELEINLYQQVDSEFRHDTEYEQFNSLLSKAVDILLNK